MRRALFFTVYDRPHYFAPTLSSWSNVRGLEHWHVVFRIEPSEAQDEMIRLIEQFVEEMHLTDYKIVVNERRLGVLHHPWVGFEELFSEYDFVVRAEDDLVVSTDILEYLEWASTRFHGEDRVGAVHSYSLERREDTEGREDDVVLRPWFNPLIWGTWKDRWVEVIRDTWDHDYSTFNGRPGNQCLPIRTEILTRRGWLSHSQVETGDLTIGFNPATGLSEWTPVTCVISPFEAETVTLFSPTKEIEATREHRWLTELVTSRTKKKRLVMRTTDELTPQNTVILAARAETGEGLPISDDEAALLGWVAGDGSVVEGPRGRLKFSVSQKKVEWFDSIERSLTGTPHSIYNYEDVRTWCLSTAAARDLMQRVGHPKKDALGQVLSMSPSQRSRWLEAMDQAEGTDHGSKRRIYQCVGPVSEALQVAMYLEGHRPSRSRPVERGGWSPYYAHSYGIPRASAGAPHTPKTQTVWCVSTELGTWTARQDDRVFLTGNSGWDWNLNTRVFPEYGLLCAHPCQSRTDHIGVHGTHGNEENFRSAETFRMSRPETVYQALSR